MQTLIVSGQVSGVSGTVLETLFKQWDSQGTLLCNIHLNSSHPVYIVQTTGGDTLNGLSSLSSCVRWPPCVSLISPFLSICLSHLCLAAEEGFLGLLSGIPKELQQLFSVRRQQESSYGLSQQENKFSCDCIIKTMVDS